MIETTLEDIKKALQEQTILLNEIKAVLVGEGVPPNVTRPYYGGTRSIAVLLDEIQNNTKPAP